MRVSLLIGMLMVKPVNHDPACRRILERADSEHSERVFQPLRATVAPVRQQAVVAGADAERAEDIIAQGNQQQSSPAEQPRYECQGQEQMINDNSRGVRPDEPAATRPCPDALQPF